MFTALIAAILLHFAWAPPEQPQVYRFQEAPWYGPADLGPPTTYTLNGTDVIDWQLPTEQPHDDDTLCLAVGSGNSVHWALCHLTTKTESAK